ncbi:unnamed protein product [Brassicogethes aeneus]|uniref:Uncharacterized protein n=1 Tax=Brassicogethes aeneus TaxID=1431903 RepID=A0A9P0BGF3_BRAAE|nr:unnamed protein product [Brassicogethes aeneus]
MNKTKETAEKSPRQKSPCRLCYHRPWEYYCTDELININYRQLMENDVDFEQNTTSSFFHEPEYSFAKMYCTIFKFSCFRVNREIPDVEDEFWDELFDLDTLCLDDPVMEDVDEVITIMEEEKLASEQENIEDIDANTLFDVPCEDEWTNLEELIRIAVSGNSDDEEIPMVQPMAQQMIPPMAQPILQPIIETMAQPVIQPMVQPMAQAMIQQMAQSMVQKMAQPMVQQKKEQIPQPMEQPKNVVKPGPSSRGRPILGRWGKM